MTLRSPRLLPCHLPRVALLPLFLVLALALAPRARATVPAPFDAPLTWTSGRPLVFPAPDAQHAIVSVKDPSVVYYNGKWHVFATTANQAGNWSMEYLSFTNWEDATTATPFYLDQLSGLSGYHCAPQVFYFRPQNKWYLIYQSPQPSYSTTDDIDNPQTWTSPKSFFSGTPSTVVNGWIDFWIICDDTNAYLFFSDDHGRYYRSQTTLAAFPSGFSDPQVIMQDSNSFNLFEASCVYHIKNTSQYLCMIECIGPTGHRFFRGFTADSLGGDWTPLPEGSSWATPFAGANNVTAVEGGTLWTNDISHGEFVRDGYDETMTLDPANLTFLYQGQDRNATASDYVHLPWRLALLHAGTATPATHSRLVNISSRAYCGTGDQVAIGGFVVGGDNSGSTKRVLIRAIGPGLTSQGLTTAEVLADPVIEVHDALHGNAVIASNDNWSTDSHAIATTELGALVGATAIPSTDQNSSAMVLSLPRGVYSFVSHGANSTTGIVLLEIYEIDTTSPMTFADISTRAQSGTGNNVAIGGFVISGPTSKQVLLRAVGPTLATLGVPAAETLADPSIELHDALHNNQVIALNDNWSDGDIASNIPSTSARVGAAPLAEGDTKSAAVVMSLNAGVYSFIARGSGNTSGVVLVEVYDAD